MLFTKLVEFDAYNVVELALSRLFDILWFALLLLVVFVHINEFIKVLLHLFGCWSGEEVRKKWIKADETDKYQ